VLFVSKEETMMNFMNEKKQIIGILSILFMFAVYSNSANAAANVENNLLSQEAVDAPSASEEAFSISTAEEIRKKYENATSLTDLQLKELLKAVGFKGKHLKEAWAIAKRESGGNPLSFNGNIKTGDNSYGLFQVNMLGILGPDRRNKFELRSNAELFNPVLNAEIAFYMTDGGTDWSSWKGMTPRAKEWLTKFPA
jgi:hypothetical protein